MSMLTAATFDSKRLVLESTTGFTQFRWTWKWSQQRSIINSINRWKTVWASLKHLKSPAKLAK